MPDKIVSMSEKKIDFEKVEWENSSPFLRSKSFEQNGKKVRVVELKKGLDHPDWCETGHIGYVLEGELDIDFDGEILNYKRGDVLFIASGETEKHIPIPKSEKVLLLLVEEI